MSLPDYDRFIIEAMTGTLRSWIDKRRHDVVWLKREDIDELEKWAKELAEKYRQVEFRQQVDVSLRQPNEGWTPAEPWPHKELVVDENELEELLSNPVTVLEEHGLEQRELNMLDSNSILTLSELVNLTDEEFRGLKNCGPQSLGKVLNAIQSHRKKHRW